MRAHVCGFLNIDPSIEAYFHWQWSFDGPSRTHHPRQFPTIYIFSVLLTPSVPLHKFLVIAPSGTYCLITVLVHSAQRTQRPDIVACQAHIRSFHVVDRTINSNLFLDAHPQSPTYSRLSMKGEFPLVMVMVGAHTAVGPPEGHEVAHQGIYIVHGCRQEYGDRTTLHLVSHFRPRRRLAPHASSMLAVGSSCTSAASFDCLIHVR
ncbi:hypothetical protein DENSPDRAFT_333234 [Dentipellis sp. KUC8613]|nr:hypothetical protein DENSPDRAFT_333234 [Dentipellis sp. KUC8613]